TPADAHTQHTPTPPPPPPPPPPPRSKKSSALSRSAGTGSRPPPPANSPIQVVPIRLTSGVWRPAMAVAILSWAPSQGTAVTLTVASGLSFLNASASWGGGSEE